MKLSANSGRKGANAPAATLSTIQRLAQFAGLGAIAILVAFGTMPSPANAAKKGRCDDKFATAFKPDKDTTVLLVEEFKQGDPVALSNSTTSLPAPVDVCLVKLVVGPGNPGPEGAPSTSPGIGIELWLPDPDVWNERIRNYGSGGYAGGYHADITRLSNNGSANAVHLAAVGKGYVVGTSDHGHGACLKSSIPDPTVPCNNGTSVTINGVTANVASGNGSFLMNPDGSINTVLWHDFSERSMHELAVKTQEAVKAFYGKKQKYAYWDGFSTGGRQGYKLAQKYPADFDGILAGAPAFNWTKFITSELYPQVVMQRELGGPLALTKLNAVSTAAVASCGGSTLGFLLDPLQCRYDPTKDAAALCLPAGTNADPTKCVTPTGAAAIDRIWYGETTDGTYADPAIDNAAGPFPIGANHLWFGLTRGTTLGALAGTPPFSIASVQVALELQDPAVAQTVPAGTFVNATGNGANKWTTLSYAQLANAFYLGIALQPVFSDINTDNPDLSGARDAGTKVLSYHGSADQLIMPQGSINYFTRASAMMGGNVALQKFDRLFLIPGMSHDGTFSNNNSTSGSLDPATGAVTSVNKVPLPQPSTGRDELFEALLDWVEGGNAPVRIDLSSANGSVTMPICMYPLKATYKGSGSVTATASYDCK